MGYGVLSRVGWGLLIPERIEWMCGKFTKEQERKDTTDLETQSLSNEEGAGMLPTPSFLLLLSIMYVLTLLLPIGDCQHICNAPLPYDVRCPRQHYELSELLTRRNRVTSTQTNLSRHWKAFNVIQRQSNILGNESFAAKSAKLRACWDFDTEKSFPSNFHG